MKKEILLSIGILFCVNSFAQNIKIDRHEIIEKNDTVSVSFTAVIDKIKSNERLTLTPVIYNGDSIKSLEPIIITGRNRAITDKRQLKAAGIPAIANQHIPYNANIPHESWMCDISLRIDRKIESCCNEQMLASLAVMQYKPIHYDVIVPERKIIKPELSPVKKTDNEIPFLAPISEYEIFKENTDVNRAEGALILHFRSGENIIDPTFADNGKCLEQVRAIVALINADPNASVGKIVLSGASSPEGSTELNEQLARKRVDVLRNYLKENIRSINIDSVESVIIGEDWIGLRDLVEQSEMEYKTEVLEIIDNVPVMQGRKKQLMDLKGGRPYIYMKEHFFPKLRNAGCIRIFYESKPDLELEKTNQAIELCNNSEYRDALTRIEGVAATSTTEYIRGVCYMMLGEYDSAQQHLTQALQMGNTQASEISEQVKKLKAFSNN